MTVEPPGTTFDRPGAIPVEHTAREFVRAFVACPMPVGGHLSLAKGRVWSRSRRPTT
jgi:hypothetical protein